MSRRRGDPYYAGRVPVHHWPLDVTEAAPVVDHIRKHGSISVCAGDVGDPVLAYETYGPWCQSGVWHPNVPLPGDPFWDPYRHLPLAYGKNMLRKRKT